MTFLFVLVSYQLKQGSSTRMSSHFALIQEVPYDFWWITWCSKCYAGHVQPITCFTKNVLYLSSICFIIRFFRQATLERVIFPWHAAIIAHSCVRFYLSTLSSILCLATNSALMWAISELRSEQFSELITILFSSEKVATVKGSLWSWACSFSFLMSPWQVGLLIEYRYCSFCHSRLCCQIQQTQEQYTHRWENLDCPT